MAILLIHTGGTIGMVQTASGFAPQEGLLDGFVQDYAQAQAVQVDIKALAPLIDSANATPDDWDRVARTIEAHQDQYDGVVVTHGTDTLAYSAAALCFALEGLRKPVIVTGAMLPLSVEGSDGVRNLHDALDAAREASAGVWVQFAGKLMHGARVWKSHSKAFDAFAAEPSDVAPVQPADQLSCHAMVQHQVAVVSVVPGMPEDFLQMAAERYDGLVLRCYGSGTVPNTEGLARALDVARARKVPVIGVSQCPEGGMALGVYAAAALLVDKGVVDGRDMTVAAAYAKLLYTLSRTQDYEARLAMLRKAWCGEFTA